MIYIVTLNNSIHAAPDNKTRGKRFRSLEAAKRWINKQGAGKYTILEVKHGYR